VRARLAFQPLCEGDSGSLDRLAPGPRPVVCLVGFRVPRTLPQADAARACVAPVTPRGPPNRPPCHFAAYSTSGYPATVPGSCRGRYHTDRQPGAALPNTAMCPAGPPARSQAVRADHRKAREVSKEKVWIDEEWTPAANRSTRLPAEAATTSPHAGHAIQDAVLLVMPEPAPRHM